MVIKKIINSSVIIEKLVNGRSIFEIKKEFDSVGIAISLEEITKIQMEYVKGETGANGETGENGENKTFIKEISQ